MAVAGDYTALLASVAARAAPLFTRALLALARSWQPGIDALEELLRGPGGRENSGAGSGSINSSTAATPTAVDAEEEEEAVAREAVEPS